VRSPLRGRDVARRFTAAILTGACLVGAPAAAGACPAGYTYAGLQAAEPAYGVAGTLSASATRVERGHVAAWVGVGGHGLGPGGSDEWIQVGLSAVAGSAGRLYYEVKRPGRPARYVEVDDRVELGERHRVAVIESRRAPGWWRVWVDGRTAGRPVRLPGSHGRWHPIATAESWSGRAPACNRFRYRFELVTVASEPGGAWEPLAGGYRLADPAYGIRRNGASFVAFVR
jgi:hypothetical protein